MTERGKPSDGRLPGFLARPPLPRASAPATPRRDPAPPRREAPRRSV